MSMARWAVCGMLLLAGGMAWGEETVVARALALLEKSPPAAATDFTFIVTGDSQSNRELAYQTDVFKGMLDEFNLLKPAFVVEVGDLILGGAAEGVPPQWDLFQQTIAACEPPYFPAPGNHDISDAATERMWLERMGPTHYAFSYGNSRFIVLDSEEVDALDRLSDAQVAWFKQELESTKASNIFVFLHQPYFACRNPAKADEMWEMRWKYLADVMRGHPVRAVFAGHLHGYMDFGVRDGIHYAIAAGAASFGKGGNDADGRFNHYALVRVRGEDVTWSVIKAGAVLPSNVATIARAAELSNIRRRLVACDNVLVPFGEGCDRDIAVRVQNPYPKPFDSSLAWETPAGWRVEPATRDYSVAANGTAELAFHVRADNPASVRFPVPVYKTRYANSSFGEPVDVFAELPLVPVTEAARAEKEVHIDGVLDEWKTTPVIPMGYLSGFENESYDPANLSGQCRVMWDNKNLYVAFDIADNDHCQPYGGDIVWLADSIELGFDEWSWAFSLTKSGPEVFLYEGVDVSFETINKDVRLAARREAGHTIYEGAFPARLVKPLELEPGSSLHFRAEVHDLDNSGPKHDLSLSPGGDNAPGIKVVLRK